MSSNISPKAKIAEDVVIGPNCYVEENVEIGSGTILEPNVVIYNYTKIGKNCHIFPGAVLGAIPQDKKYDGEITYLEIGDHTTIRECVTLNRGTAASGKKITKIGDNCLFMSYVHVAHDCKIGDNVILTSYVGLAGETDVDDWAIIGGASAVHQFSKIGAHCMISGGSMVSKDIPPYSLAGHRPSVYCGINIVGLRRRNFSREQIDRIKSIYNILYYSGMNRSDACKVIENEFEETQEKRVILDFIKNSKRGIIKCESSFTAEE
ncbi:MAG: acyl-ACP--UDP-N-acetylglucosamine O-acyltransferase [Bacteroidales bacterium]